MDKQGPAVKHVPIKFSSCRGVAFEIKPSQVSLFAPHAACAAEKPPTVSNGGRWVWFPSPVPVNREHSLRSALSRATSSHFCDLDDNDADDDESFAANELEDDEEMALSTEAADVSDVRSRSRRSLSSSAKPARAAAAKKGHSRLGVILLDQGLFTMHKRLFLLCAALNAAGLAAAATGHFPYAKGHAALFAMGNILALTLCRSELVLRAVFWLAVMLLGRPWVPVTVKTAVTAILQALGGVHSGCGVSSLAWLVYALVRAVNDSHATPREIVGVAGAILGLLVLSYLAAFPLVRHLHHNVFERTHRFAGWTALALLWVFVLLSTGYDPTTTSYSRFTVASLAKSQVWVAKGIDANYGDGMSAMLASNKILGGRVIVHDTATMGRPNVADLAVRAARRWNAEAVIVTSNPEGRRTS
uniref:Uncharacterized protein n=1 Tax=Avena sativa TaxID=4498 RepID=A0ACD5VMH2_AVESA